MEHFDWTEEQTEYLNQIAILTADGINVLYLHPPQTDVWPDENYCCFTPVSGNSCSWQDDCFSLLILPCLLSPVYYEGLQDKLAQVRDARAALNALRDEHREKLRRAAEEAERQRQIQLAQKLEIMRQKKQVSKRGQARRSLKVSRSLTLAFTCPQEYLEMQRQLAIQRLQEQEKERQMRLEQQKHTIQMRAQMPAFSLPYAQVATSLSSTSAP